ncbi:hypothetical protein K431DRAFT_289365 [Polychaeton citri CBS 116435]|uniref:J domain-containing protein n=1 Tax=Polychaeton citri CBS 116435 TaxID=1314669 RepID=A0A9P4UKP8_9PEZI|nr:hypothetical protein K431DRAFT_289365 [Polychaeton citri CBS 116435]
MALPSLPNHYAALSLDRDASPATIRAKYYQLARLYHPNRHQGSDETKRHLSNHFNHIFGAWQVLSHPNERRRYDELLQLAEMEGKVRRGIVDLDDAERGRVGTEELSPTTPIDRKWSRDHDWSDPASQRRKLETLRMRELKAFYAYQAAIVAKLEAEVEAERYQEYYEDAQWRREQFQNMPKETSVRMRVVKRMNNVVKALRPPRPPRRPHRSTTVTYPSQIVPASLPGSGSFLSPDSVQSPPRGHRRGYSSDISGDQTSSEEESGSFAIRRLQPRLAQQSSGSKLPKFSMTSAKPDPPTPEHSGSEAGPPRMFIKRPTGFDGPRTIPLHEGDVDSASLSSASNTGQETPRNGIKSLVHVSHFRYTHGFAFAPHRRHDSLGNTNSKRSGSASSGGSDIESTGSDAQRLVFERRQLGACVLPIVPYTQVLDLQDGEKARLLRVGAHSQEVARTLLDRFTELDSTAAGKFMIKPDIKASFHFRLIFGDEPAVSARHGSFIALSYRRKLLVEKRQGYFTLPLEPDMFQAVLEERDSPNEGIWVDQICIDQDSDEEMTLSMSAMDMVYRSSRKIVVALDDIELTPRESSLLESHMAEYTSMTHVAQNKRFRRRQPPYLETHEDLSQVTQKLLSSSWFRRAWCRHEMRLAHDHVFLIHCQTLLGSKSGSVLRFTGECMAHLLALATEVPFEPSSEMIKPALHAFFRDRTRIRSYNAQGRLQHGNFTTVIAEVFAMDAGGNPRLPKEQRDADALKDKLQIVLNTMEAGLTLSPSFIQKAVLPSQGECFYMLTMLALAHRDPGALCTVGHPMNALRSTVLLQRAETSWMFEPTNIDAGLNNYRTLVPLDDAAFLKTQSTTKSGEHYIELDIKLLSTGAVSRPGDMIELMALANNFVSECETRKFGRQRKRYLIHDTTCETKFGSMKDLYARTLACIFHFGPDWMAEICRRYHVSRWKIDLQSASWLLITLRSTNGMWPDETNGRAPWLKDAASFLMDLANFLIIRGMPLRQITRPETWRPVCVQSATRGKVLTFVPVEHENIQPAIPAVLFDEEYQHLARLWILKRRLSQPPEEYNSICGSSSLSTPSSVLRPPEWTLLGKSVLFSDEVTMDMVQDEKIGVLERARIFGRD